MDLRLFTTVFVSVFLAELGDKTQLATFLYAADAKNSGLTVFLGSASALVLTSALGVALGGWLSDRLDPRVLAWVAGLGFVAVGAWTIAQAELGRGG
jgi:putative Ca2+/H+ antiporter (TMEM165/GDT1 family)